MTDTNTALRIVKVNHDAEELNHQLDDCMERMNAMEDASTMDLLDVLDEMVDTIDAMMQIDPYGYDL